MYLFLIVLFVSHEVGMIDPYFGRPWVNFVLIFYLVLAQCVGVDLNQQTVKNQKGCGAQIMKNVQKGAFVLENLANCKSLILNFKIVLVSEYLWVFRIWKHIISTETRAQAGLQNVVFAASYKNFARWEYFLQSLVFCSLCQKSYWDRELQYVLFYICWTIFISIHAPLFFLSTLFWLL